MTTVSEAKGVAAAAAPRPPRHVPYRVFVPIAMLGLGGYLFFGKAFAYLHVPGIPAFVGEIILVIGIAECFRGRRLLPHLVREAPALRALVLFVLFGIVRLAVDVRTYGLLAVRDSAIWYYALVALIVVMVLHVRPGSLDRWVSAYRRVIPWFLLWAPIAVVLSRALAGAAPRVPDSTVSMLSFKPGDFGVQAAMALAFWWLVEPPELLRRHRRAVWALTGAGIVALLITGTQNRGGLISGILILAGAWLYSPMKAKLFFVGVTLVASVIAIAVLFDVRVSYGGREVSMAQLTENLTSIVGRSEAGNLDETVEWRQELWTLSVRDVTDDRDIITGFGFGPNIAERYGFNPGNGADDEGALRSPHNSHLSVLTRMGGIGFLLWLVALGAWFVAVTKLALRLRKSRSPQAGLLAWCALSVLGLAFNANFDPTLEGPQVAFWFWTLYGVGIATVLQVDRAERRERSQTVRAQVATGA